MKKIESKNEICAFNDIVINEHFEPKVSVGMLVYNGEKYLRQALESLTSQTYYNIEIIISDNASTDNTKFICEEYCRIDNRIRYTRQSDNIGLINNYKFVLQQAKGDYFMWASHDDLWSPTYINDCLNIFNCNSDCVSVFSHASVINLKSNELLHTITPTSCSSASRFFRVFTRLFEMHPNMIYGLHKIDIIKKIQFDSFDWFDIFITIQLSYYGKVLIIPNVLYLIGIDGKRTPYSITGKYFSFNAFRKNMHLFLKAKFPLYHRFFLQLFMAYISYKSEKKFNKILIDNIL
ncbi:MAG: glycosyltransferase, partial [Bacteroidales bacterium]|nr:glycosyltransferase [Bacteroidales bacterium]